MSRSSRLALCAPVTTLTVALDQLTKAIARATLAPGEQVVLLGGLIRILLRTNIGAFLGLGSSLPPMVRTVIFGVVVVLLLTAMTAYLLGSPHLPPGGVVGASLVVGGGAGNLIDRVGCHGEVTDFLNVGIGPVRTGIFNVADLAIVGGVVCLLLTWPSLEKQDSSPSQPS